LRYPTKRLGTKEAERKIGDSLLKFNFFSLGEVRRTISLFSFKRSGNIESRQVGIKLDGAELGSVIGLIRAKHREQSVHELTHYGYDRLETSFAATEQTLIQGEGIKLDERGYP
jgi:hypothetical protein